MSKKLVGIVGTQIVGKVDAVAYVAKNGYPEVGTFLDKKCIQKFYKQLDTDALVDWCTLEGLAAKPDTNDPIYRMRVCMLLLYKNFPKVSTGKAKAESPYKKFTLENLVTLALENDVAVEGTEDEKIFRMRLIMALRANKIVS